MRQEPQAHRVLHMLPLQPTDTPELSAQQKYLMAQDLAERFSDYVLNELDEVLGRLAEEILEENHIDPHNGEGVYHAIDLMNRIAIVCN